MLTFKRSGRYYRLFKPGWADPLDPSFSKARGGRWAPPGEFGAVYLSRTLEVAAANARVQHAKRAIGLFDLRPDRRPRLLDVRVPSAIAVDVVTDAGVAAAGFPKTYPAGVDRAACWPLARRAYASRSVAGIACRSNAESTVAHWPGEELAWFDRSPALAGTRIRTFDAWYPGPHP